MSGELPSLDDLVAGALARFELGVCVGCAREDSPDLSRPYLCPACRAALGNAQDRAVELIGEAAGATVEESQAANALLSSIGRRLVKRIQGG